MGNAQSNFLPSEELRSLFRRQKLWGQVKGGLGGAPDSRVPQFCLRGRDLCVCQQIWTHAEWQLIPHSNVLFVPASFEH